MTFALGIDIEGAILAASGRKAGNVKVQTAIDGFLAVHEWMDERGILTPLRLAHLFGQCAHESMGFTHTIESLSYSADRLMAVWPSRFQHITFARQYARQPKKLANYVYARRMGNGDPTTDDGWRYRGRGYLQLTGRANYRRAGKALGIDLEVAPERATDPEIAWQIAASYLATRSRSGKTALVWADADNVKMVTRIVNGGLNGLADRIARTGRALDTLELPNETIKETTK
ncbi:MAG: glycoside hydrolase family 19 protein [Chloroflexi bacterium]|nr:glycoside hydrolase family 19 protein [Chloroflexota bacterium]